MMIILHAILVALLLDNGQATKSGPDEAIKLSTERLQAIHRALILYERTTHQWPNHLSDLVPEYLPDEAALQDPADPKTGGLGSDQALADPKFRVSYSYERCSDESNGLAQPLGRFPKPDLAGTAWGSWRLVNERMEYFFGDQSPLVRCYLHRPPEDEREPGHDCVLNLTPAGRVYRSDYDWRRHPDSIAFMLRTMERDLAQSPAFLKREWILGRVDEFLREGDELDPKLHGPQLRAIADGLMVHRKELADDGRAACNIAATCYGRLGQTEAALAALDAATEYQGSKWSPIVEKQKRAAIFHAAKQWDKEIAVLQELLVERPTVRPYMERLAKAYEAAGQSKKAKEWHDKADPGALLVGKPAPDFNIVGLQGEPLTLASVRNGHKAVLIDFWFCGCGPCRQEMPYLEKLYQSCQAQGLEIVAMNFGDSRESVAKFVSGGKFSFPVGLGRGSNGQNKVFDSYHVSDYPTSYLLDADGKIVWRGVGYGAELKKELPEALAKLGFDAAKK